MNQKRDIIIKHKNKPIPVLRLSKITYQYEQHDIKRDGKEVETFK